MTARSTRNTRNTRALWSSILCALCVSAVSASPHRAEQALVSDLNRIFHAPAMVQGVWAVEVKALESGRILYSLNPRTLMMPASNMKILTLAAAAETLGWDYRFPTTLESAAPVQDGALAGDLVIVGGGDPTMNARGNRAAAVLDEWASKLKALGVTRIDGNVIGDASRFEANGLGQGWAWDDLQYGYAAPVSALQFNENTASLTVTPGAAAGDQAKLELAPDTGLGLVHQVTTGEPGSPTDIAIQRSPNDRWLEVSGSIATDAKPIVRDVAIASPARYFARAVLDGLAARGIPVRGLPVDRPSQTVIATGPQRVLVESFSPPLREIAATMMKVSQNLYAETLLKQTGAIKSGGTATAESGRSAAREILGNWNIPAATYVQVDGSGLSRYDYVTADLMVTILEHMFKDPRHREAFMSALPIAGTDGTIASRLKNTRAEGNAIAKTGSIANVRALSGYVRTRDGETLAFSMLANSFTIPPPTVTWIADVAVETLSNYSVR